jgi:hypothetical protein
MVYADRLKRPVANMSIGVFFDNSHLHRDMSTGAVDVGLENL